MSERGKVGLPRLLLRLRPGLAAGRHRNAAGHTCLCAEIRRLEQDYGTCDDNTLRREANGFRLKARASGFDSVSRERYFALVSEIANRRLGLRPFDAQLLGALALDEGCIAEMAAGEGKTLAAVLPVARRALDGQGFHVLAANDYLARRDANWMRPIFESLGITVAHIQQGMDRAQRRAAYAADVTYVAATEAGFDYLRDHLVSQPSATVQRAFHAALVDEIDSILIDEARMPLVIAGGAEPPADLVQKATRIVRSLVAERHYVIDGGSQTISLTSDGIRRVEDLTACGELYTERNVALLAAVNVAMYAAFVLRVDVDYIVHNGIVQPVDPFKGRVAKDRRWPGGVHAAIEAKEGLRLTCEGKILGTLTLQGFIALYPYVSGMTGTAATQADEFADLYGLSIVVIPPRRPIIRRDNPDLVYCSRSAKEAAVIAELRAQHEKGRPVLVGTASVEESERLARDLANAGIACRVLNARNDELEAEVIAEAGDVGAVTISTNMAGRGTDIRLGGANEARADEVRALGGLYVVGTNRHDARRIDHQLRGRAGRQGDPGESRFFVSLEDDLFARHGLREALPQGIIDSPSQEPIPDNRVAKEIDRAQRILEGHCATIRKELWSYDMVVEKHRHIVYQLRDDILTGVPYLRQLIPQRYDSLVSEFGEVTVANRERATVLAIIDRRWSAYLADAGSAREGIDLRLLGNQNPLYEFHKITVELFEGMLQGIESEACRTFCQSLAGGSGDPSLEGDGIGPTWNYVQNEVSLGTADDRLLKGLARLFKNKPR
jgi:preprotein translocase subunit SecA